MGKRTSPEERRATRAALGRLADARVNCRTRNRYQRACQQFVEFLCAMQLSLPVTWDDMDLCLQDYLEHLWSVGASTGQANDTLSGVQHFLRSRRQYPGAWRLLSVWSRLEVPTRAPPMPARVAAAMAGWALERNDLALAACILAGFHLCLRTGEILGLNLALVQVGPQGRGVVSLPWTKTAAQKGARETVTVDDPYIGAWLHRALLLDPAGKLWSGTLPSFHAAFKRAAAGVGLRHARLTPYSLRRGGATHEYLASKNLERVMLRGRWSSIRTAKIYIEDGAAILAEMKFSRVTQKSLDHYVSSFVARSRVEFG